MRIKNFKLIPVFAAICLYVAGSLLQTDEAYARPARQTPFTVVQPDGFSFEAKLQGDEYASVLSTTAGNAIILGSDGYYQYAFYDEQGHISASGWRVGGDTPADVLARSREIPYSLIWENGRRNRPAPETEVPGILKRMQNLRPDTKADNPIAKKCVVILVEFEDLKFTDSVEDFDNLLNIEGYNHNGATGSAKDYFNAQFNGTVNFSFDVYGIASLPENYAYYGKNTDIKTDARAHEMIIDACKELDSKIDFSQYDQDGDGYIDDVYVFYAGGDEAELAGADHVWAHSHYVYSGMGELVRLDGKILDLYACSSERRWKGTSNSPRSGIGTFCHEFSHTLGLNDFYDTDYEESGGYSKGLYKTTSIMDSGNMNNSDNTPPFYNAIDREVLGLSSPILLGEGNYSLEPIHKSGKYYRLNTDVDDEYFLIECRSNESWDKYIGGSGLLVYHIDKSTNDSGYSAYLGKNIKASQRWQTNEINCNPDHPCAYILPAYNNAIEAAQAFFPFKENNALTPNTDPALKYWSGIGAPLSISNIAMEGDNVTFTVTVSSEIPTPIVSEPDVFQNEAIISWTAAYGYEGSGYIKYGKTGTEKKEIEVQPYEPGKYCYRIKGLNPRTTYQFEVYFKDEGVAGGTVKKSFLTKSTRTVKYPYIYLNSIERNSDGSFPKGSKFPLVVFNAEDAETIVWEWDGLEISTGDNGYYTADRSGVLTATIYRTDGSKDIISKTITVK